MTAPAREYVDLPLIGTVDQVGAAIRRRVAAGTLVHMSPPERVYDQTTGAELVAVVARVRRTNPGPRRRPVRFTRGAKVVAGVTAAIVTVGGTGYGLSQAGDQAAPGVVALVGIVAVGGLLVRRRRRSSKCTGLHCSGCSH